LFSASWLQRIEPQCVWQQSFIGTDFFRVRSWLQRIEAQCVSLFRFVHKFIRQAVKVLKANNLSVEKRGLGLNASQQNAENQHLRIENEKISKK